MDSESTALIFGTNLAGYRAAYALCKKGHRVVLLNRGHKAVAVVDYQVFPQDQLEPLTRFDLVACGDADPQGHAFNRWLLKVFARWKKDLRVQELPDEFASWSDFLVLKKK